MNAKARELGLDDTHYVNPHGLDQPGHVSSARDAARLVRAALEVPLIRQAARLQHAVAAGRDVASTDDVLALEPRILGAKTGHTDGAGWSQVAAARERRDRLRGRPRLAQPRRTQHGPAEAPALEPRPVPAGRSSDARPNVRRRPLAVRQARRAAGGAAAGSVRRCAGRPLREEVVAPASVTLPVARHARLGEVRVFADGRLVARAPLVAADAVPEPGLLGKAQWYATRALEHLGRARHVIVTVTLNSALDRTLSVPIFQLGHRHRANDVLTVAGGKGINVARRSSNSICPSWPWASPAGERERASSRS